MQFTTRAGNSQATTGRVLVLGTDDRVSLAVARSLGRNGIAVHLGWWSSNSVAMRSRYVVKSHQIPPYAPDNDSWKQALRDILIREHFDLVIPCNDSTLVPLVANRADFAEFGNIYLLPDHVFSIVSDKFNTYALAKREGVPVPRGCVTDGSANPATLIQEYGLPLVLKPQATITTKDVGLANVVRKIVSPQELETTLLQLGTRKILVQENFVGRGVGVEMLVHEGRILVAFQHARIHETMEWGSAYRRSVAVDPELLQAAERLMRAIGYTGVAMAEFIVNPGSGRWVFLEINGRFWGSLPLAVAARVDFPFYLYQMLVAGKRQFAVRYREEVRCRNLPLDLAWVRKRYGGTGWRKLVMLFRVAAELSSIVWHRDHLDSFAIDDPLPQLAELRQLTARLWKKIWRSIPRKHSASVASRRSAPVELPSSTLRRKVQEIA